MGWQNRIWKELPSEAISISTFQKSYDDDYSYSIQRSKFEAL